MMTADDFQRMRAPALLPSDAAFPPQQYPERLVAGQGMPVLPHQAMVLFSSLTQDMLPPPVTSLYRRPFTTLTTG